MSAVKLLDKHLPVEHTFNIFQEKLQEHLKDLRLITSSFDAEADYTFNEAKKRDNNDLIKDLEERKTDIGLICTTCKVTFESLEKQKEHFRLDWHRYNLKQKEIGKTIVSEDEFESQISGELSSISGSDASDNEDNDINKLPASDEDFITTTSNDGNVFSRHPYKNFYLTKDSNLLSIYKNVVNTKKSEKEDEISTDLENISPGKSWMYVMLSGGHFAAAIYSKNDLLVHKTYHRYTVRAKRGTIQSVQDKKQGGHAPKSAGASIRRYNEAALFKDIETLFLSWNKYIKDVDQIFYRCSTYSISSLFNEKVKLKKDDSRLVKISLSTNRPTLNELKRIHNLFSTVNSYGNIEKVKETLFDNKIIIRKQENTTNENKSSTELKKKLVNVEKNREKSVKVLENEFLDTDDEIDSNDKKILTKEKKKKPKKAKNKDKTSLDGSKNSKSIEDCSSCQCSTLDENLFGRWKRLQDLIQSDDIENLELFFDDKNDLIDNEEDIQDDLKVRKMFYENNLINFSCKRYKETLLHSAVRKNCRRVIPLLMSNGADPTVKNFDGKLSYDIAENKDTRNEFRKFMARYPEKYDYKKGNIPSPLTEEEEAEKKKKAAEKKKTQNKIRKEKNKLKKAEERQQKLEEKERQDFEALSDREKRAVMAERRFASQLTNSLRCSNCRTAINEKDAFVRYEYKYCSVKCTHEHKTIIGK